MRLPEKKAYYDAVSAEKEAIQLSHLRSLFEAKGFRVRQRVEVKSTEGKTLTDVDLLVLQPETSDVLLLQAKWLLPPDYAAEIMNRNTEFYDAISVAKMALQRVEELGLGWVTQVCGMPVSLGAVNAYSMIVSQHFLPSGWVTDAAVPIVDTPFLEEMMASLQFRGLKGLHADGISIDAQLKKRFSIEHSTDTLVVGEYGFQIPTIKSRLA